MDVSVISIFEVVFQGFLVVFLLSAAPFQKEETQTKEDITAFRIA
jgi:hypothetical protein